ncbi:LSU ribosomal protein L24p (L26e) [Mariniradius saccharolyticus AK6]|jgi:large subunit ribosomal protein L24|uniref:Large ribosomal subunit protein uL24 n=2 Tax=Mariniradius TaxID=1245590 RepID=M7XF99_9BACT|nr:MULTISPECIES: 50S ribosomal protein L24 [Mariniradius]EMS33223.1 LSU ribosomal protein L24p (L26e) [Mariniradius saccharolyticus AK6]MCF1751237.1 50S ribosomal protein L24 [Mariniradius sediminis]
MERKFNKQPKLHVRSGDTVKVIAGDDKGKSGKILSVDLEKRRAIVEGLNLVTKHVKPSASSPQGGIQKKEAPIHVSNLMLVDPKTGEATRTGRKKNENGKLVRYSKKTGEVING